MPTKIRIPALMMAVLLCGSAGAAFADVTLTSDKTEYTVGEIVHLTVHNNGPEVEQFLSAPFFLIFNEDSFECIFGCIGLPVITPFLVGETVTMDWDTGAMPDLPGLHTVSVALSNGPSITYLLTAPVSVEASSWGTLKGLYR